MSSELQRRSRGANKSRNQRLDLSDWLIHFLRDPTPSEVPEEAFSENYELPLYFDQLKPIYPGTDSDYDSFEKREKHCAALPVLRTIISEGWLRPSWSFRDGRATVYGPRSAVCFTEMPLGSFIDYVKSRSEPRRASEFAIAIKRASLYAAGARPVVYGLSGPPVEAGDGDPYFGRGLRCLASTSGLGLEEQYRYVSLSLDGDRLIDWMHEREWRWPYSPCKEQVHGLPIWAPRDRFAPREIVVIVPNATIAEEVLDLLAHALERGYTDLAHEYCKETLQRTRVLPLDRLRRDLRVRALRLEDLTSVRLPGVKVPQASSETRTRVRRAIAAARESASAILEGSRSKMRRDDSGMFIGLYGFAEVVTYFCRSEITAALLAEGLARPGADSAYRVKGWEDGLDFEGSVDLAEAAADAAATLLSRELGQRFFMHSRLD